MPTASETMAAWVANLRYEHIPQEFIHDAKNNILDMIGCGIFGSSLPWARVIGDMVLDWSGDNQATVWGRDSKVPAVHAVFANTNAANSFEYDDTYFPWGIHPGALVVSSALAAAEQQGHAGGKSLISAVVAGHEVSARVRVGLGWSVFHGWNSTAICSAFGAAVSAAKIFDLDAEGITNAIGTVGPYVGGLLTFGFKAGAKRVVNARAAEGGMLAAVLAKRGVTGYSDILESEQGGFCKTHSSDPKIENITKELGNQYEMRKMALKKYPNCTSFHAVLDALYEITGTEPVNVDELESVIVHTTTGAQKNDVGTTYDNVHSAQMSMPYAVAVKLLDGVVGVEQFSAEKLESDKVRDIAERVEITVDPELDALGLEHRLAARVELVMKNGKTIESGTVRNPRRMNDDEVLEKFYDLSTRVIDKDRAKQIVEFVESLESQSNIVHLAELLK